MEQIFRITRYILRVFMIVFVCVLNGCGPDIFNEDYKVRQLALEKINNQVTLKEIASGERYRYYEDIREAAMDKLTDSDQMFLADIATRDHNEHIRKNAIAKISDQTALTMVVQKGKWNDDKEAAFAKITDQDCLAKIAIDSPYYYYVNNFGSHGGNSNKVIKNKLYEWPPKAFGMAAVTKLTRQDALEKVALEGNASEIRRASTEKLQNQTVLEKIALEDTDASVRKNAVINLCNQTLLAKISIEDKDFSVREAAATNLWDQTLLTKIIIEGKSTDREVLKTIFAKLNDPAILNEIEKSDADSALRIAAHAVRLYDYSTIFSEAFRDSSKIEQTLTAIYYLQGRKDSNLPSIPSVCRKYITLGYPNSIPFLIRLLNDYGEKDLAEDYINCGQSDLEDAGKSWASAHGYVTRINYGSSVLHWGGMVNKR